MNTLPTKLKTSGFDLEQIFRVDEIAVYRQTKEGCDSIAFEVVRIREHGEREFERDGKPVKIEAGESYPPAEKWGVDGFTFTDEEQAYKKAGDMMMDIREDEEAKYGASARTGNQPTNQRTR